METFKIKNLSKKDNSKRIHKLKRRINQPIRRKPL